MAIGITSDSDFDSEIQRLNGSKGSLRSHVKEGTVITPPARGRSSGDTNVPESLRKIIGEESVINGRQSALDLAADFGISASSVSAYAKGATSTTTYDTPNKALIGHINNSRKRAIKRASSVMNTALKAISPEKLDYADPKDLASIAKDMTVIIKNLEPPAESVSAESNTPKFVIFAPQFRDERSFDSIVVNE